ncbi:hypothetical protein INT47_006833 [Mucor saturninus]|uniref:Uncharacterized protein n=1 Tax=Mucor saturninus TaxID=64648 RepID=A0A8H7R9U0_9FUNG|nr:hypothetical protein INT47_006833 [Mucor saturninus]
MRLSIIASLIALSATSAVASIDRIVLYADSFSDNGNDYRGSKFPPSPPYWKGRFSNGPTWAEHVAKAISIPFVNNGHGGATTNNEDVYSAFNNWTVPGLKQQVATIKTHGTPKSLYIIEIGYNDLNAIINPDQYNVVNKHLSKEVIAKNVVDSVKAIIKKYKAKKFLFMSVPPFDHWPVIQAADKARTNKLITSYNALVTSELKKKIHGIDLKFIDTHGWFLEQLAHPENLGLSTSNGPCDWGIGNTTAICDDPEKHFFFDSYHPEAKVHKAWGKTALVQLKQLYNIH